MIGKIVTSAVFAGIGAGVLAALLQLLLVVPLVMEAELFESGARTHFPTDGSPQSDRGAPSVWEEPLRHVYSVGFSAITFTAYAFLLIAGFLIAQRAGYEMTARKGVIWGICGALAVVIAPAIGMPPEVPGAIGVEVEPRQLWYLLCVICTLAGLVFLGFGQSPLVLLGALVLIAAPHLFGAPKLDTYWGVVPAELASEFVARVMGVALMSWAMLGLFTAYFWTRSQES